VTGARDASGLLTRVERVCRSEADDRMLRLQVLDEIRGVVSFDWYAWVLTDPATEVGTSPVADTPNLADLPRLVRAKYVTEVNRWTGLSGGFVSLMDATQGNVTHSLVWREVLSEYGVCDVASGVFRDRYGLWAFLDLWRTNDAGPFTSAELEGLSVTLNVVTEALRRTQARAFTATELSQSTLDGPVVMLLSPHLEVLAETEATIDYLRALLPTPHDRAPIPACAYNVAAQLVAHERGVDAHRALARLQVGGGHLLTLRAARIAGSGAPAEKNIAVTIATASGEERAELFARTHALSSREAELLGHLNAGRDTREISAAMYLSEHTVQDHLKSIFAKTGVRSRRSLVARVRGR
jgi:DNA-binding CsgD family transcriptional regulator